MTGCRSVLGIAALAVLLSAPLAGCALEESAELDEIEGPWCVTSNWFSPDSANHCDNIKPLSFDSRFTQAACYHLSDCSTLPLGDLPLEPTHSFTYHLYKEGYRQEGDVDERPVEMPRARDFDYDADGHMTCLMDGGPMPVGVNVNSGNNVYEYAYKCNIARSDQLKVLYASQAVGVGLIVLADGLLVAEALVLWATGTAAAGGASQPEAPASFYNGFQAIVSAIEEGGQTIGVRIQTLKGSFTLLRATPTANHSFTREELLWLANQYRATIESFKLPLPHDVEQVVWSTYNTLFEIATQIPGGP